MGGCRDVAGEKSKNRGMNVVEEEEGWWSPSASFIEMSLS
jgi:hypothetical protein